MFQRLFNKPSIEEVSAEEAKAKAVWMARGIYSWSKAHPSGEPCRACAGTRPIKRGDCGLPQRKPQYQCRCDLAARWIYAGEQYGRRHDELDEAALPGQLHI